MRPYSQDIRTRVIDAYLNKEGSQQEIAHRFKLSVGFVRKLLKRYRDTGSIAAKEYKGRSSKIDRESLQVILRIVDDNPTLPLSDLCDQLASERHLRISRSTMWRTIKKYRPRKASLVSPSGKKRVLPITAETAPSSLRRVSEASQ